jgi:methionine-rich copper-binding protein CopC
MIPTRPRPLTLALAPLLLALLLACLAGPRAADAHAIIIESAPRHEESVVAPSRLVLRFNGLIEKRLCSLQLVGPQQRTIALLRQEPDAPPDTLAYPLPRLEPGTYQARWKVMSADGHVTEGTVVFTVVPGAAPKR